MKTHKIQDIQDTLAIQREAEGMTPVCRAIMASQGGYTTDPTAPVTAVTLLRTGGHSRGQTVKNFKKLANANLGTV